MRINTLIFYDMSIFRGTISSKYQNMSSFSSTSITWKTIIYNFLCPRITSFLLYFPMNELNCKGSSALVYTMYCVHWQARLYDVLCRLVYMLYCVDWQANYANYRASEGWCATTLLRCLTISTNNVQVWCCFYQISDGTSVLWGILHYYSITCGSSLSSESLRV